MVADQDGKGPVQLPIAMRADLAAGTDRIILSVDQRYGLKLVTHRIFTF